MVILSIKKIFDGQLKGDSSDAIPPITEFHIEKHGHIAHVNCRCVVEPDWRGDNES